MALNKTPLFLLLAIFITNNLSRVQGGWVRLDERREIRRDQTPCGMRWIAVGEDRDASPWLRTNIWAVCHFLVGSAMDGSFLIYDDIVYTSSFGSGWRPQGGRLVQLSVGAQGAWGVDSTNKIFRWDGRRWINIPGQIQLRRIASGSSVWGLGTSGNIYRYAGSGKWKQVLGNLKEISVSDSGEIWGINSAGDIYRRDARRDVWQQIRGKLVSIAVDKAGVWGITATGNTLKYSGSDWVLRDVGSFSNKMVQIDVGDQGVVGVNQYGIMFSWSGPF